jgi:outer membrane lipoprotein LolB
MGRTAAALIATFLIAGCAVPLRQSDKLDDLTPHWQGRLSVKVTGPNPSSFSSSFELQGNATAGQLAFTNTLGTILARISWAPGSATLQTISSPQTFPDMDALTLYAAGAELPLAQLFDWLQGQPTPSPGWEMDLSAQPQGRISAHRSAPLPNVDLRIVLE